jgi:hypothetical protein
MKKKKELVVVIMYKGKQSDERYRIDIDIETSDIGLKRPNSNVMPDINESLNEYPDPPSRVDVSGAASPNLDHGLYTVHHIRILLYSCTPVHYYKVPRRRAVSNLAVISTTCITYCFRVALLS